MCVYTGLVKQRNQMDILKLIGRCKELLTVDIEKNETFLRKEVQNSSFLVIGGAGSIGQAVTNEIFPVVLQTQKYWKSRLLIFHAE